MSESKRKLVFWAMAGGSVLAWLVFHFSALIDCAGSCYVDLGVLHGYPVAHLEFDDTRLNSWILAWAQHALLTPDASLFDANVFYPAPLALAGSEHLLGQALFTLPMRMFTDNAILTYAWALIISYGILGLSTIVFVRWLTSSRLIALAAGAVSMAMPWREAELSHIQLLWACWFPLIVYLALRLLLRQGSWRHGIALTVVLTLQLLSSYYLAYMITFTLATITIVVVAFVGLERRTLFRLLPAAVIPYLSLVIISIPYLSRVSRGEITVTLDPERPFAGDHLANAIDLLMPRFNTLWQQNPGFEITFFIPATILLLALLSLIHFFNWQRDSSEGGDLDKTRARIVVLSLWLSCLVAFIMTLGSHLSLGESNIRLPGYWSALLLPGFSNLRAPHRWAIVICTLMPVLAALGASSLDQIRRKSIPKVGSVLALAVGVLVFINIPWKTLPVVAAMDTSSAEERLYTALDSLPYGPVLELPWHLDSIRRNSADTRYMVNSTRHWRPILNGFTAHEPKSFALLNRIAQELPDPWALDRLLRLTNLRWIVVHWAALPAAAGVEWRKELPQGLEEVFRDEAGSIFEVRENENAGIWMQPLLEGEPRERTLSGLSREALDTDSRPGGIVSVATGPPFRFMGLQALKRAVRVEIDNPTERTWPSLDVQIEGLVGLRYTFSDLDDRLIEENTVVLDTDLPPGETLTFPIITAPPHSGTYRLCLDLVQFTGGEPRALDFDPVEVEVKVAGFGEKRGDALERLAIAYRSYSRKAPKSSVARCAQERSARPSAPPGNTPSS